MNKKSKKTLKNAFNIPEPNQKDSFFNKLDIKPERKFSSFIPVYLPTAIVAVMVIGVWGGIKNLPRFEQPENTDNNIIYSSESSVSENQTDYSVQTSLSSVRNSENQNRTTTAVQNDNGNTVTDEKNMSVTTTSAKTTNKNSDKNKDESSADSPSENSSENTSDSTSEASHTTNTSRNTTNVKTTGTTTLSTRDENNIKPTKPLTSTQTTTTEHKGFSPLPQTTTTTFEDSVDFPSCTAPVVDVPPDYTIKPPVRYYPDNNAVDINDVIQNDPNPPSTDGQPGDSTTATWEDFLDNSDMILIATVDDVIYTAIDGVPYTQENISVSEVIKGDIEQYSKISVYSNGGYIPASEYKIQLDWAIENNFMLFDPAQNKTVSQVGDEYLYFIKKSHFPLPDGSYSLTTYSDMSKFRYKDGHYINMNNSNIILDFDDLTNN